MNTDAPTVNLDTTVRCRHCGIRGNLHRGSDGRCPGAETEPRWPSTIRDEAKAGAVYDARLSAHWSARKTTFDPRR